MSVLQKCIRFSWDVVSNPPSSWQGVNDRVVEDQTMAKATISEYYKEPVVPKSAEFYQMSLPMILLLRNTKHPLIAERNFFWDEKPSIKDYYPKDWGQHLTEEERNELLVNYKIIPEHRFVMHFMDEPVQEAKFVSQLALTHAFTTYTVPSVCSLNELATAIADNNFGANERQVEEYTLAPMLIITDVFGTCERLNKASGTIASILKERMYNGRTTVFCDTGKLYYPKGAENPPENMVKATGVTKQSLMTSIRNMDKQIVSINSTQLHPFFFGGMTYVMNTKSFSKGRHTSIE